MDQTYKQLARLLGNVQDEGLLMPTDMLNLLDTLRPSMALEGFRGVTEDLPLGVPFDRDTQWNYKADWEDPDHGATSAPDWFLLRSKLVASAAQQFSRITGVLRPTTDTAGVKYVASDLARVFLVNWSLYAETSHSMSGAVSTYRGDTWPSGSVRQSAYPFDTGITPNDDGRYPFVLKDTDLVVMSPNDELRWRFEYFGSSDAVSRGYNFADGVLTPTETTADDENPTHFTVYVKQLQVSMVGLGVLDGFQDTLDAGGNVVPASSGDFLTSILSDVSWRTSGLTDRAITE